MTVVYTLLHRDTEGATAVLGVFSDVRDANAQCLSHAADAGVDPTASADKSEPKVNGTSHKPMRWEAPDGTASWVERHDVVARKPAPRGALQRNESQPRLYDNDDDDVIEVLDDDAKYD